MRSVIWFVSYIRPCLQESVLKFLHAGPFVKTISRILLSCSCREFWTPFASPGALPRPLDTLTYSAPLCPTAEPQTLREGSPYSRAAKVLVSGAQRGKYFPKEETAQDGQCSWTITSEITLEDIVCRMGFCRLHLCVILWKLATVFVEKPSPNAATYIKVQNHLCFSEFYPFLSPLSSRKLYS